MNDKIRIIAVVGPTASGKTALAVQIAKKYGGEIISADSMQIYKGMDIATAKPTEEEKQGIPHHLMDFLEPTESFSVSQYVDLAHRAAVDISSRGRLPVLCGGTGLYVRSFLENITFAQEDTDPALREEIAGRYETLGGQSLIDHIRSFDPVTADKLLPSQRKRIIRVIELYESTGRTMSQQLEDSRKEPSPYDVTAIGLTCADRQKLYDRINRRVDIMLSQGLLEEARQFYAGYKGQTASAAIGYKELKPYLDGEISLEQAVEKLKQETRHYAKRQLTWFRRDEYIRWIETDKCADILSEAEKIIDTL